MLQQQRPSLIASSKSARPSARRRLVLHGPRRSVLQPRHNLLAGERPHFARRTAPDNTTGRSHGPEPPHCEFDSTERSGPATIQGFVSDEWTMMSRNAESESMEVRHMDVPTGFRA